MRPWNGQGWNKFLRHSSLVNQREDKQLKVICTILTLKSLETRGTFDTIENINEGKKRLNNTVIALDEVTASQKETQRKFNETIVKLVQLEAKSTASQKEAEKKLNETNEKLAQLESKIDELEKGRKAKKSWCLIC